MRYFTKEWYDQLQLIGTSEMYMPIEDREYDDEAFAELYDSMLNAYIEEEERSYNSKPEFIMGVAEDEFDPEDFLIELTYDNGESEVRHPESYDEFVAYQEGQFENLLKEFENRPPFDAEEARAEFENMYQENLEGDDDFLPSDIAESVDPRLLALGLMPESVHEKLVELERAIQEEFDRANEEADDAYEELFQYLPDEFINLPEDFELLDGNSVIAVGRNEESLELLLVGLDEDGYDVQRTLIFDKYEVVEEDELEIEAEESEEDDILSNCDLLCHEIFYEDDRFEVHMMFENEGLKYLTVRCEGVYIVQESEEE